jgi:pilus assembly protein Flp/PilA
MRSLGHFVKSFLRDEQGLEMVEYAIVAGLIAVAAIISITALSTNLGARFQVLADRLK